MTKLKMLREHKGLTQAQLAGDASIAVRTLKNYEAGRRKPPYEIAKALAKVLDVPMDQLF